MKWTHKARIQSTIARLPFSESLYYFVQRRFGTLHPRVMNPLIQIEGAIKIIQACRSVGREIFGSRILEIGTGRRLEVPIVLWLMGASEIVTVDLNKYLKPTLVWEAIAYIRNNVSLIEQKLQTVQDVPGFHERLSKLIASVPSDWNALLETVSVRYLAPADARCLPFPDRSFDYHVSLNVLEHIPTESLKRILIEAKRLLKPGGTIVHAVDPSDHFSHQDESITEVNFLQFDEAQWSRLAGNQHMYHNRLRSVELLELFAEAGFTIIWSGEAIDPRSLRVLQSGFPVDRRFKRFSPEELAVTKVDIVANAD